MSKNEKIYFNITKIVMDIKQTHIAKFHIKVLNNQSET